MLSIEDLRNSELPRGWVEAFGDYLVDEINAANPDIKILQAKEKFGALRLYYAPASDEVDEIISKYEVISEHTCIGCGKPDVAIVDEGWVYPVCRDCYNRNFRATYEEVIVSGKNRIPDEYEATWFTTDGKKIKTKHDISADVRKIRARWEERNGGNIAERS